MLNEQQQAYYDNLPNERKIKWLKDELLILAPESAKDWSTGQSIYNSDSLTNPAIEVISLGDLLKKEFPLNRWLVKGLIPKDGRTGISSKPKVGKTLLSLDLAISLTLPRKFLGEFEVEQQTGVMIISKEDPQRLTQERMKSMSESQNLPIYFCTSPQLFLDNDKYIDWLAAFLEEKKITTLVLDSFRRIFQGDENSSQVVSAVHRNLKILEDKNGITTIFTHHHGKEGFFKREAGDKLRGSSDILAMLDSLLVLETKDKTHIKVTQAALRQDKSLSPFIIEFPDFESERPSFKFINYIEEEVEKSDKAKSDISNLLADGKELNQTEIIKALKAANRGYGDTTVKNSLKELVELDKLALRPAGKEKFYSIIVRQGDPKSGQEIEDVSEGVNK